MSYSNLLSEEDQRFLAYIEHLRHHDRPMFLAILCMCVHDQQAEQEPHLGAVAFLRDVTQSDFKWVIKTLKSLKKSYPYTEHLNSVVDYIRHEWLHREGITV